MTQQDRELIIQLWNKRTPIAKIVQMLPYEPKIARRYIREVKESGELKSENRVLNDRDLVVQAYNSGMTNHYEIARTYGINIDCVITYLSKAKLQRTRPPHNYKKRELPEKTRQIIAEIQQGVKLTEIAKKHGVTRQFVSNVKIKYCNSADEDCGEPKRLDRDEQLLECTSDKEEKTMNYFYIRVSYKALSMDNQILAIGRYIKSNNLSEYEIVRDISNGFVKRKGSRRSRATLPRAAT